MNVSNLTVNFAIRSRSSSNPKLILGSESAIDGASAEERGGRIALVDKEGSKTVDIFALARWIEYVDESVRADH